MTWVTAARLDDGGRVAIQIDRPKGNVLTAEVIGELRRALAEASAARGTRLITISGAGPDFSFGASVEEHTPQQIERTLPQLHGLIRDLLALPAVTAAVVRGRCLGGGFEVALACDLVFAADDARLGVPEIALGVFPPAAAALLPLRVGTSRATSAILCGDARPASWWHAAGLIERLAPAGALDEDVAGWYRSTLATRSGASLGQAAVASRVQLRHAVLPALEELERQYLHRLMRTADAVEGIAAFLERRPPSWRHA